jgi:hypothetical protein
MPKSIQAVNSINLDVLQAVKRAFLHRGVVVGPEQIKTLEKKADDVKLNTKHADKNADDGEKKSLEKPPDDTKSAKGPENLVELTEKSQDVLYEATTVFPLTLFPDTITLDREKLTIAKRLFWRTANITSTPVSEIMSCEANVGPFFGSLHLTFRFFTDNQRTVSFLSRADAIEMQRLIHGYIIAHRREIDVTSVDKKRLVDLLSSLGQGATD